MSLYPQNNDAAIRARISESNSYSPQLHLCLHSNASGTHTAVGPEILYYSNSADSKKIAEILRADFASLRGISPGRPLVPQTTEVAELRDTTAVAVLVEVGFHDNQADVTWMYNNWSNIAQTISNCVDKYDEYLKVKDAVAKLQAKNCMNTPDYWISNYSQLQNLGQLLISMSNANLSATALRSSGTAVSAINYLYSRAVINSPDYWINNYTKVANLDQLFINVANRVV